MPENLPQEVQRTEPIQKAHQFYLRNLQWPTGTTPASTNRRPNCICSSSDQPTEVHSL